MIIKPKVAPGIVKDNSELASEGRWIDGDKVRFRMGFPELIGGQEKVTPQTLLGKARAIHQWEDLSNRKLTAIGTHRKLYAVLNSKIWDITPVRAESTLSDKFDTTDGDETVTVTHTSHGLQGNTRVYIHNGTAVGGLTLGGAGSFASDPIFTMENQDRVIVTLASHGMSDGEFLTMASLAAVNGVSAGALNKTHRVLVLDANRLLIQTDDTATAAGAGGGGSGTYTWLESFDATYIDADTYTIEADSAASSTASSGGGTITYKYEINPGREFSSLSAGYGTGTYGTGYYSLSTSETDLRARVWHLSNYGEDLVANYGESVLYRWQGNVSQPAAAFAATDAPAKSLSQMVTPERFLVALGTEDAATSTFDKMRVAWATQEGGFTTNDWTAAATNTAGDFRLSEGSRIVRGMAAPSVSLIWTDTALYGLQYLQDTSFIFRADLLGTECGLIGPNAMVRAGDSGQVFWLSSSKRFFVWRGGTPQVVQCPVRDYLFDNLKPLQDDLIFAGSNSQFNEVWWFYPTQASSDTAAYVAYNYVEGHWTIGTFAISAWIDRGTQQYPMACHHDDGYLRFQEKGNSDDGAAFSGFVESGFVDLEDGDRLYRVNSFMPDFKNLIGGVDVTLTGRIYPQGAETEVSFGTVGTATTKLDARITARQIKFKFSSNSAPTRWRVGSLPFDVIPTKQRR